MSSLYLKNSIMLKVHDGLTYCLGKEKLGQLNEYMKKVRVDDEGNHYYDYDGERMYFSKEPEVNELISVYCSLS